MTAGVTGRKLILGPEAVTRGIAPHVQNVLPEPPHAREENEAENRVTLPDGCTDGNVSGVLRGKLPKLAGAEDKDKAKQG